MQGVWANQLPYTCPCMNEDAQTKTAQKIGIQPWPVWLSWLEHCPIDQKGAGLSPSLGVCEKASN